jgi:hypothetical protein
MPRMDHVEEEVQSLIDALLAGQETQSEIGRVRAYRTCLRYAEETLAADHLCNVFLLRAAEQLGQPPMAVPVTHNRVPLSAEARLCFYYHDEEGPVLVGNPEGLRYLGALLTDLADAPLPGEHIELEEECPPMVSESYGLTMYRENEEWFEAAEAGMEDELVAEWESELGGRIMSSGEIVAMQFTGRVPSNLPLCPHKIYRLLAIDAWAEGPGNVRKPYRQDLTGVRMVTLVDDDGQELRLGVDLDDPDIAFYYDWHLEQFGALREN